MNEAMQETPDFYRRRYEELKAAAQAGAAMTPPRTPDRLPEKLVLGGETIPPGCYWTTRLARGEALRLANPEATPGVSVTFWNADDTSERFNHGDSVKLQWTVRLDAGKLLMSDMGRVLMSVIGDAGACPDAVLGGSTPESEFRRHNAGGRNARDNLNAAAGKHGLSARDIGSVMNFFSPIATDAQGRFRWIDDALRPGAWVDLRAEMNLILALSNTPHPLAPDRAARAVTVTRWRPEAMPEDACRGATREAVRAFENTDAYFAG